MGPELQPPAASAERGAAEAFTHAVTLHRRGEHGEAARTCELLLRADPRHSGALHLRGLIALEGGQLVDGIELIRCSLGIDPQQPHAHSNIGNALLKLQRPEEALASFESALRLRPDYVTALYNRGNALRALGRVAEAEGAYRRAIEVNPGFAQAWNNLGTVLREMKQSVRRDLEKLRTLVKEMVRYRDVPNWGADGRTVWQERTYWRYRPGVRPL